MIIIVGFTERNHAAGYIPTMHGYVRGAAQVIVALRLPDAALARLPATLPADCWAEALWLATNCPRTAWAAWGAQPAASPHPPKWMAAAATAIADVIDTWTVAPAGWRHLSKGDTVLVNGQLWACASIGFDHISTLLGDGIAHMCFGTPEVTHVV